MHEMALANDVVENVVEAAHKASAQKVQTIYLTIGDGRDIVEGLFERAIGHLSRGTVAEGAEIIVNCIPYTVRCNDCGSVYHLNLANQETWPCPSCREKNYALNSGMEFWIDRIEVA